MKCRHCGGTLAANDVPCPRCGERGRDISVSLSESLSMSDHVEAMGMKTFSERKRSRQIAEELVGTVACTITFTVLSAFVSSLVPGSVAMVVGPAVGVVLDVARYFISSSHNREVREITRSRA